MKRDHCMFLNFYMLSGHCICFLSKKYLLKKLITNWPSWPLPRNKVKEVLVGNSFLTICYGVKNFIYNLRCVPTSPKASYCLMILLPFHNIVSRPQVCLRLHAPSIPPFSTSFVLTKSNKFAQERAGLPTYNGFT